MNILKSAAVLVILAVPAVALAHAPVSNPYDTRGECEAQLAEDNIFHAQDKVAAGEYKSVGEAMKDMHDHFWCEEDPDDGFWYMMRIPF